MFLVCFDARSRKLNDRVMRRFSQQTMPFVLPARHFPCTHNENDNTRFVRRNCHPFTPSASTTFLCSPSLWLSFTMRTNSHSILLFFLDLVWESLAFPWSGPTSLSNQHSRDVMDESDGQSSVEMTPWTPCHNASMVMVFNSGETQTERRLVIALTKPIGKEL